VNQAGKIKKASAFFVCGVFRCFCLPLEAPEDALPAKSLADTGMCVPSSSQHWQLCKNAARELLGEQ